MVHFKRNFVTGLITIFPLWLTFVIIWIVVEWISGLTMPMLKPLAKYLFGKDWGAFVDIVSFFLAIFFIWLTGLLATQIVSRKFLLFIDRLIIKIPVISGIYLAIRKLTNFFFQKDKKKFKSVVLVEFPREGSYAMGFVTGEGEVNAKKFIRVFVPTTPNPTTGFLLFVHEKEIVPLDLTVDEAFRAIISGGIVMPHSLKKRKEEGE